MSRDDPFRMKLLVATDGSEESERAVEYAARDAVAHDARLNVVHVVESEPAAGTRGSDTGDDPTERGERTLERARSLATEVAEEHDADLPIDVELRSGRPPIAIIDHAEEIDAESLYLGHRVLPAQREAVVGSVAKDVLDTATIPVTIVP